MDILEAIKTRHSVRSYTDRPIEEKTLETLQRLVEECNEASGLHIQLVTGEPRAFNSILAHYGLFSGVTNYIAMIGKQGPQLEEQCGYWGEKLVLEAQMLGLNTCWVALTYRKIPGAFTVLSGEKLVIVIATGYGSTSGRAHRSKSPAAVSNLSESSPDWFRAGVTAALLAPTAVNQQRFYLRWNEESGKVTAKAKRGPYTAIDLGIVKYHFEIGAEKDGTIWA